MKLTKAKVMIALPNMGSVKIQTHGSIGAMVAFTHRIAPKVHVFEKERRESMIDKSRCVLAEDGMSYNTTHIFWLDSDMVYPPHLLITLLSADRDIVGCSASSRSEQEGIRPVAIGMDKKPYMPPTTNTITEVLSPGGSPLLVRTNVYSVLGFPWYKTFHDDEEWGEDRYFFKKARSAGYKLWCCDGISYQIGHIGEKVYTLADVK